MVKVSPAQRAALNRIVRDVRALVTFTTRLLPWRTR
jgi:hypothetical protein